MINEFEFFHGAALTKLVHAKQFYSITTYQTESNSSYILNNNIGIFIKYSTKRLTPWRFTFKKEHQDEILEMKKKFKDVFVLMVCNKNGVVCLSFEELKLILDHSHASAEWISASRSKRQQYLIKGSDGKLKFKIRVNDFSKIKVS